MFPTTDSDLKAVGQDAARLLREVGEWVLRRKESVEVLDETLVRRRMSVDFRVPEWVKPLHQTAGAVDVRYAPLFLLQKGSDDLPAPGPKLVAPPPHFANFDLQDAEGTPLPLPPRVWNAEVSVAALLATARQVAGGCGHSLSEADWGQIEVVVRYIATAERNEAENMLKELREATSASGALQSLQTLLSKDPFLSWLLAAAAVSSIASIPLRGDEGREGIVKLAYDEQVATFLSFTSPLAVAAQVGWAGYPFWIDTPFVGAKTYHVEVVAPEGTEIYDAGLLRVPEESQLIDESDVELRRVSGVASRVHLYAPDASLERGALTWVRLRVRRQQFFSVAAVVSALVTAVLWIGFEVEAQVGKSTRGIPELLLLFPAAIATYAVRPAGHRLTSRMLRVARGLLTTVSLLPFVAAARLALEPRNSTGNAVLSHGYADWWFWLAVISTVATLAIVIARILPLPGIRTQRLFERLGVSAEKQQKVKRRFMD